MTLFPATAANRLEVDGLDLKAAIYDLSPERLQAYVHAVVGVGVEIRKLFAAAGAELSCDHRTLFPQPQRGLCDPEALFLVCTAVSSRRVIVPAGFGSGDGLNEQSSFERPDMLFTPFGAVSLYSSMRHRDEIRGVMPALKDRLDLELVRPARPLESPPKGDDNYCRDFSQIPAIYRIRAFDGAPLKAGNYFEMRPPFEPTLTSALLEHTVVGRYIDQLFQLKGQGITLI